MKTLYQKRNAIYGLILSLEDNTDGISRIEKEYVYYCQLEDIDAFMQEHDAKKVLQEQYELKIPLQEGSKLKGRLRVRAIDNKDFILCVKANTVDTTHDGTIENELETTESMFDLFKQLTVSGLKKYRYTLPIPNTPLKWEVDVFVNEDNTVNPWVKVDLEIPSVYVGKPPSPNDYLPIKEIILNQFGERTEEEEALITKIYDGYQYKPV